MAKEEGYLNISIAWDDEKFGIDYMTPELAFELFPDGINVEIHEWDEEIPYQPDERLTGDWVFASRNFELGGEEDDA